jgi:hypothetical protein
MSQNPDYPVKSVNVFKFNKKNTKVNLKFNVREHTGCFHKSRRERRKTKAERKIALCVYRSFSSCICLRV